MATRTALLLLAAVSALAHGGHDHGDDTDNHAARHEKHAADESLSYAERHMHAEHHIDEFDPESFFKLHDLDMNGFWDSDEIAAIYGLRHHSVIEDSRKPKFPPGLEERIVKEVLRKLDTDNDGKVSEAEFVTGGLDSLPKFDSEFKDLGHHYDEESEYFLHHEELYHSTPETQTDESYTHPEDIQHFRHHDHIEDEEDARERIFEGLSPDADLAADHAAPHDPLNEHAHAPGDGPEALQDKIGHAPEGQAIEDVPDITEGLDGEGRSGEAVQGETHQDSHSAQIQVEAEHDKQASFQERIQNARESRDASREPPKRIQKTESQGQGRSRHSKEERLRKDAPYKYKMRPGFRSDEF